MQYLIYSKYNFITLIFSGTVICTGRFEKSYSMQRIVNLIFNKPIHWDENTGDPGSYGITTPSQI